MMRARPYIKLSILSILILTFLACNPGKINTENTEVKWKTFIEENCFGLQYPDFLYQDTAWAPQADAAFGNSLKGFYLIVFQQTKDTLVALGYDNIQLSAYTELVKQLHDTASGVEIVKERMAKVNGMNAVEMIIEQSTYDSTLGKWIDTRMKKLIIEGEKNYFQLCVWCERRNYEDYTNQFNKIISSFREL
jgi:hypothetical protein